MKLSEAIIGEGMLSGLVSIVNKKIKQGDTAKEIDNYLTTMINRNEIDPNLAAKATPTERDEFIRLMGNPTVKNIINANPTVKERFDKIKSVVSKPSGMPGEEEEGKEFQVKPSQQGQRVPQNGPNAQLDQALNTLQSSYVKANPEQRREIEREYLSNPYKKRIFYTAIKRGLIKNKE